MTTKTQKTAAKKPAAAKRAWVPAKAALAVEEHSEEVKALAKEMAKAANAELARQRKAAKKPAKAAAAELPKLLEATEQIAAAEAELDALDAKTAKRNAKVVAALPKVHIADACAWPMCELPPMKGASYCLPHAKQAQADIEAMVRASEDAKRTQQPAAPGLQKLFASIGAPAKPEPKAKKEKAPKAPKAEVPAENEAPAIIYALRAKGWSDGQIGLAMGANLNALRSTVWGWRMGKRACQDIAGLKALLLLDAPSGDWKAAKTEKPEKKPAKAKAPKAEAAKEQVETGSLKAPAAPQAAKTAVPYSDERQLMLELRDALNAVLAARK